MQAVPLPSAAYGRISKDNPDLPKIGDQLADCRALAAREGYATPVEYGEEPGTSATKGKPRPTLNDLIRDVLDGRFRVVLAVEQSRFNRSVMDNEFLMAACIATGTILHTVRDGKRDPSDDADEFTSTMFAARDRMEARRIGRRVRAANDHLILRGRPIVTKRPFGYEPDGVTQRALEADAVRWAIDHVLHGGSIYGVVKELNRRRLTPTIPRKELAAAAKDGREPQVGRWTHAGVRGILLRPGTYGLLVHRSQVVDHEPRWTGIGTPLEYDLVTAILTDVRRKIAYSREPKYLLSGLLICSTCDGPMFHASQRNPNKQHESLHVYRCTRRGNERGAERHQQIMQPAADDAVIGFFALVFVMNEAPAPSAGDDVPSPATIQARLAAVRQQKLQLAEGLGRLKGFEAEVAASARALVTEEEGLERQLQKFATDRAGLTLAADIRTKFWEQVHQPAGDDDDLFGREITPTLASVADAFRLLPLDEQKALIRSTVRPTVMPVEKGPLFRVPQSRVRFGRVPPAETAA